MKKLTHEEFTERFTMNNPHANTIEILGTYEGNHVPIECHCKVCNCNWTTQPYYLINRLQGCPVCGHKKIVKGINDISTIRPDLLEYFIDKSLADKYSVQSHQRILCQCPLCGFQKEMNIYDLASRGFSCNLCSDKSFSYPNRFGYAFLSQLPIQNHIREYSPDWIKPKRFDNYFEYNGKQYILEMDGGLHYKDNYGKSLEVIQSIDNYKDNMASLHNITVIRIECKKTNPEYIVGKILNSELSQIFELENYNWEKCFILSKSSSYIPIWNYLNNHLNEPLKKVGLVFNKSYQQLCRIIKYGHLVNMCEYQLQRPKRISVYKENQLMHTFNSMSECKRELCKIYNISITIDKVRESCLGIISEYKGFTFQYAN